MRLRELAANRVRFGYRRLTVMLRREGWRVNPKRVYRLYTEDGLTVRTKLRKKLARRARVPTSRATRPNMKWSMDFLSAKLLDGRWFRGLTVIDQFYARMPGAGRRPRTQRAPGRARAFAGRGRARYAAIDHGR
jgi:putative transposase